MVQGRVAFIVFAEYQIRTVLEQRLDVFQIAILAASWIEAGCGFEGAVGRAGSLSASRAFGDSLPPTWSASSGFVEILWHPCFSVLTTERYSAASLHAHLTYSAPPVFLNRKAIGWKSFGKDSANLVAVEKASSLG
jgi:hypothetical protein